MSSLKIRLARSVSIVSALAVLAGCAGSESEREPVGEASDRETVQAVIAAHERLTRAIETGDLEGVVGLLEPTSDLLIFHPRRESRFDRVGEVREGFERMFRRLVSAEWTSAHSAVATRGDVAWHTSHVVLESENLEEPFLGRATEIWVRGEVGWRLAHAHWSATPE
jgi:ketosteroid isomerase-like protein